jgi:hypothetical protein
MRGLRAGHARLLSDRFRSGDQIGQGEAVTIEKLGLPNAEKPKESSWAG